jgi:hypothetical protein
MLPSKRKRPDDNSSGRFHLKHYPKNGFWVHEKHEKTRKIKPIQQNSNSPNRLRLEAVYLSDFVRVFRAFRG